MEGKRGAEKWGAQRPLGLAQPQLHIGLAFCTRRVLETVWVCKTLVSVKVHSRNDPIMEDKRHCRGCGTQGSPAPSCSWFS